MNLKLVVEGSEEQGTGGLEDFVPKNADLLRSDVILVCDTGNAAVGRPAATVSLRGLVNVIVTSRGSRARKCTLECSEGLHPMHSPRWSRCWRRYAMTRATPRSPGWTTARPGRASRIRLSSSEPTPAYSMAHRFWEMAVSATCCGRVPRSPFSASTVRRSSDQRRPSHLMRLLGSICAFHRASSPIRRTGPLLTISKRWLRGVSRSQLSSRATVNRSGQRLTGRRTRRLPAP